MPRQMTLIDLIRELESMRPHFGDSALMAVQIDDRLEPVLSVVWADDRVTSPGARDHIAILTRPESWMID